MAEPSDVSAAGECGSVGSAGLGRWSVVWWVFASFGFCFSVRLLSVLFWLVRSVGSDGRCFFFVGGLVGGSF